MLIAIAIFYVEYRSIASYWLARYFLNLRWSLILLSSLGYSQQKELGWG
jgi:hypothetical protein